MGLPQFRAAQRGGFIAESSAREVLLLLILLTMHGLGQTSTGSDGSGSQLPFLQSKEGWSIEPAGAAVLSHRPLTLEGTDTGDQQWYFAAPANVVRELRGMYMGKLSFRLGTLELARGGEAGWQGGCDAGSFDVRVRYTDVDGAEQIAGVSNLVLPLSFAAAVSVELSPRGGWQVRGSATRALEGIELQRALGAARALEIRGGFYAGAETTFLMSVSLQPAAAAEPEQGPGARAPAGAAQVAALAALPGVSLTLAGSGGALALTDRQLLFAPAPADPRAAQQPPSGAAMATALLADVGPRRPAAPAVRAALSSHAGVGRSLEWTRMARGAWWCWARRGGCSWRRGSFWSTRARRRRPSSARPTPAPAASAAMRRRRRRRRRARRSKLLGGRGGKSRAGASREGARGRRALRLSSARDHGPDCPRRLPRGPWRGLEPGAGGRAARRRRCSRRKRRRGCRGGRCCDGWRGRAGARRCCYPRRSCCSSQPRRARLTAHPRRARLTAHPLPPSASPSERSRPAPLTRQSAPLFRRRR
jgi:hypothetical protein